MLRVGFFRRRGVLSVVQSVLQSVLLSVLLSGLRRQGLKVRVCLFHAVPVLVGVALLPAELLQAPVEAGGQERSESRPNEVDPEIARE